MEMINLKKRKSTENNPDDLDSNTDAQHTSTQAKRTKEDSVCHLFRIPDNVAQITLGSYLNTRQIGKTLTNLQTISGFISI